VPNFRFESDAMGRIRVGQDHRFGAQTARAVRNFPVELAGFSLGDFPELVRALLHIKLAAARANAKEGFLAWEHRLITR
jgi:aspartate ammonia-lyase